VLEGPGFPGGQRAGGDYRAIPGTLLVAATRTIRVMRGASLRCMALLQEGIAAPPASMRDAIQLRAAMAGTAVTIGDGSGSHHDAVVEDLLILGFDLAVRSDNSQRLNMRRVRGDNRNGLWLSRTYDITRIHDVHFWPFLTGNLTNVSLVSQAVAAVVNGGSGQVRVTAGAAHGLVTGDVVNLHGIGGVPGANGRFTASVVDATRIDLQGSTFSGAWTGGGTLSVWNNRRAGTAFRVENSDVAEFVNCFAYGYDTGFDLGPGSQSIQLHNCSVDDRLDLRDQLTRGAHIRGDAFRTKWVGGFISSMATAIRVNSSAPSNGDNQFVGVMVGGGGPGTTVEVLDGGLTLVACDLPAATVFLGSAGDSLSVTACDTRSATFLGQTTADRARIILVGNRQQALGSTPDQLSSVLHRRSESSGRRPGIRERGRGGELLDPGGRRRTRADRDRRRAAGQPERRGGARGALIDDAADAAHAAPRLLRAHGRRRARPGRLQRRQRGRRGDGVRAHQQRQRRRRSGRGGRRPGVRDAAGRHDGRAAAHRTRRHGDLPGAAGAAWRAGHRDGGSHARLRGRAVHGAAAVGRHGGLRDGGDAGGAQCAAAGRQPGHDALAHLGRDG
jgi:hypothetical protein